MTTVGIIAEYNPFHKGHAYQLAEIRRTYGEDTRIVAVMSGHYPQRGDVAVADKFTRAAAAVASGVNLVLELPFPFSGATAPVFARAGVYILSQIGVDVLSFGSECGDIALLTHAAQLTSADGFLSDLREFEKRAKDGYPKEAEAFIRKTLGDGVAELCKTPNNLLGIEYIRASYALGAALTFHTVRRMGEAHGSTVLSEYSSASAIRETLYRGDTASALAALPESARSYYKSAIANGLCPAALSRLDSLVLSYYSLNTPIGSDATPSAGGGLNRRLFDKARLASSIDHLISLTATKKYTKSRIRRAIRNTVLGVTSSELEGLPAYTQLLGFDDRGREILRSIQKSGKLPILTKPADASSLPPEAKVMAEAAARADRLYTLTLPQNTARDFFLRQSPVHITAKNGENFSPSTFVEGIDNR